MTRRLTIGVNWQGEFEREKIFERIKIAVLDYGFEGFDGKVSTKATEVTARVPLAGLDVDRDALELGRFGRHEAVCDVPACRTPDDRVLECVRADRRPVHLRQRPDRRRIERGHLVRRRHLP